MKRKKKKATSSIVNTIIYFALGAALLFVGYYFLKHYIINPSGETFNKISLMTKYKECELQGKRLSNYIDLDKDYFPDICDVCIGGDNKEDDDIDYIPNACDPDDRNEPKKGTKMKELCEESGGVWDDRGETKRCFTDQSLFDEYYTTP